MSRLHVVAVAFGVAAGIGPALAQPASPRAPAQLAKLPSVETFTLPNGLAVAVLSSDAAPVVSVQLWYHAGSKDEARDRRGSAHMFEHMLFKGTQRVRPEAHARFLNGLGGYVNAATDEDATHYVNTLPAEHLDFAIQLEAERMRGLVFRKDMIAVEREVVKEEIRQQENNPIARGYFRFLEVAYTKHPYAWTAGGRAGDLDKTTVDDLKGFYDHYYQPGNALLVVVGNTTVDQVKASAQKWFAAIPKAADPPRPSKQAPEPKPTAKRREVVEPSQLGIVIVGHQLPAARDKDIYALQVASIILGAGESSRIKVRLKGDGKAKKPIALDGGTQSSVREEPGISIALGVYMQGAQGDAVEAALFEEIAALGAKPPTADELRKAKNQVQSSFVFSLENVEGLAEAIGRSWILTGSPTSFLRDVEEIEKVTAADVSRVVKQYMAPELATVVVIPPKER